MDALDEAVLSFRAVVLRRAGIKRFRMSDLKGSPQDVYEWALAQRPDEQPRHDAGAPPPIDGRGLPEFWLRPRGPGADQGRADRLVRRSHGATVASRRPRRWKQWAWAVGMSVLLFGLLGGLGFAVFRLVT